VASKTFDGVRFQAYVDDHLPMHFHGRYADIEVILELSDGQAEVADRDNAVRPRNAKRSDVQYVLRTGTKYADELAR
jgi:hypothetical protein